MTEFKMMNYLDGHICCYSFAFSREKCPLCNVMNTPFREHGIVHETATYGNVISIFNRCSSCGETYIDMFRYGSGYKLYESDLIRSVPTKFIEEKFDDKITNLSNEFVIIYNQALQAEKSGLDRIAGMGYRKAIEFLIKDFSAYKNPDDKEQIISMPLSQCINKYVHDDTIKNLAIKTVWLGNDETHYIRKHTDRDITDLKRFIQATVYFINMVLISDDAETIDPHQ